MSKELEQLSAIAIEKKEIGERILLNGGEGEHFSDLTGLTG